MRRMLLVAALALGTLPAFAQSTRERLESLELRVTQLQETLRGQALIEMAERLDALESEVRALRGELDLLQRENEARKAQQADLAAEFDRRLVALESRLATPTPAPSPEPPADGPTDGLVKPGVEPTNEIIAPLSPASGETVEVVYGRAFDALKEARYPEAIVGMSDVITRFPDHPLAANAQYWLGQTYFVTREYAKAIEAFSAVGNRTPESSKAPDALLKRGLSELWLGRAEAARTTFSEVLRRYPQSDAARAAREQLSRWR